MYISREDYLKMQEDKPAKKTNGNFEGPRSLWNFKLKNDGDESIVRFFYSDPSQFEVLTVHPGTSADHFKKINCINDLRNGVTDCPLCAAGVKLQSRFYVKLLEYVRNEDGSITPYARIWDRPAKFMDTLANLITEYGDISDCVFKIKRRGAAGDMQTDYDIMFGNPQVYNSQLYPKDFSAFEGYDLIGTNVLNKTKTELEVIAREITGFSNIGKTEAPNQTFTPKSDELPFNGNQSVTLSSPVQQTAMPRKVQY